MLTLKTLLAAAMFVASSGLLFAEHFKRNDLVRGLAALFALVAFVLLARELLGVDPKQTASLQKELITTQSLQVEPEKAQKKQPKIAANAPSELPVQMAFGSNEITLLAKSGKVFVWSLGGEIREIPVKSAGDLHLSLDGRYLAQLAVEDGVAQLQDLKSGTVRRVSFPKRKELEIDFSNGEAVVTSDGYEFLGEVRLTNNGEYLALSYDWTPRSAAPEQKSDENDAVKSHHKSRLVIAPTMPKAKSCDGDSWHDNRVSYLQVSSKNTAIVTGGWDGRIYIKGMNCSHIASIYASNTYVTSVALSSDATVVAASDLSSLRTWKIVDGKAVPREGSHVASVDCERLVFDHRDLLVACGTETGELLVIDAGESKVIHRLRIENGVKEMAFSAVSSLLAVAGSDGVITIFDAQAGKLLARAQIFNPQDWVILMPDGEYCGSNDAEKYLRVDRVIPGMIWNSHEVAFLTEENRLELRGPCSGWQLQK